MPRTRADKQATQVAQITREIAKLSEYCEQHPPQELVMGVYQSEPRTDFSVSPLLKLAQTYGQDFKATVDDSQAISRLILEGEHSLRIEIPAPPAVQSFLDHWAEFYAGLSVGRRHLHLVRDGELERSISLHPANVIKTLPGPEGIA